VRRFATAVRESAQFRQLPTGYVGSKRRVCTARRPERSTQT